MIHFACSFLWFGSHQVSKKWCAVIVPEASVRLVPNRQEIVIRRIAEEAVGEHLLAEQGCFL